MRTIVRLFILGGMLVLALSTIGCASGSKQDTPPPSGPKETGSKEVILATTTSTYDTGLLDMLLPEFQSKTGYLVKPIAVGTGHALAMAARGEADVLLVHAPEDEEEFMRAGNGLDRRLVMHNDFFLVGPPDDPANIKGSRNAAEALAKVEQARAIFISRGDDSGTHKKEKEVWVKSGIKPSGAWYQESGQGMGETLIITSEKRGYTLTDRGTYLALKKSLNLAVLLEKDPILLNIYHVIQVNPAKSPAVNSAGGKALAEYMVAKETQELIGSFGVDKYGEPLFTPDAGKNENELK
ncbi:MAG: substrate-binding domain-containing protein [Chloroflexi bacterium]|nr:substrate-binding domain-containing protein [Chloroflexota bacterium]